MNAAPTGQVSRSRTPRRRHGLPRAPLTLFAILFTLGILLTLLSVYEIIFRDRVVLGVTVLGQPMSGMTRAEARQFLQRKFGEPDAILARYGDAILVRDGERAWRAYPWELGLRTDFGPVAESAMLLGHRGNFAEMLIEQARCVWFGCDIGAYAQFDEQTAAAYLSWLAPQVETPPRDATVRLAGARVVATPAQTGRLLDGATVIERMRQRVLGGARGDLTLAFLDAPPLIADASAAKAQAEAILATPLLLTFGSRAWAIDQTALAAMLTIQPQPSADGKARLIVSLDRAQLTARLKTIAREINQPARDARLRFDPSTGALTPIVASQPGQALDPDAAAKQIEQQLLANPARPLGPIALPVTVTKPTIALEEAGKFGIKELVAQGVSNFKGSSAGRIQNIQTATAQFDGVVIPPGGTFSFNQYLGDVVEANGYDEAYIIFADRTVLGPGGGVCQVSTTVFRAAFFGGFPIVERWAHAYRVAYYEPPVGLDATVFSPTVDFKFKNDTEAYLLIQPKLDLKASTLTFNFYGTKPNRAVEMEEPIQERVIPPGPPIYTDDPTLKKGVTKQIDWAHDGMDVTVWRKIIVNGQVVKRERFFSRYEPWVARYLVGTKVVK